jgi:hypothetical protein
MFAAPDPEWQHEADAEVRGSAEELSRRLAAREGSERPYAEVLPGDDIVLRDVKSSLQRFNRQHRVLVHLQLGFPCVHTPGRVPLPIALPINVPNEEAETARARLAGVSDQLHLGDNEVRPHPPDEARGFLRRLLAPFLASRIATAKTGATSPSVGFPFRVETPGRSGLRIHYSPAYFLDPRNVFGNVLSTPVDGSLLPGRYVFGTMAPTARLNWDLAAVYRVPGPPDVAQVF